MKQCSKCKEVKLLEEFYINHKYKYGVNYICKICERKRQRQYNKNRKLYAKKHREENCKRACKYQRENYEQWKGILKEQFGRLRCIKCGYCKYFEVLDFHHLDENKKEVNISNLIWHKPTPNRIERLKNESVVLMCPTCHRELHLELRRKQK